MWHPTWVLVCILAVTSPFHLLVGGLGRAMKDGTNICTPATHVGDLEEVPVTCLQFGLSTGCGLLRVCNSEGGFPQSPPLSVILTFEIFILKNDQ